MKIYTKTGDDGTTGLFGGTRVRKDNIRIEAYGTVDELNAVIGLAVAETSNESLKRRLVALQNDLFVLGADLATPNSVKTTHIPRISSDDVSRLESLIDSVDAELEPLKNFILPGGGKTAAYLHFARNVCRRAERWVVQLAGEESIGENIIVYINRLSDLLFVLARYSNKAEDIEETIWKKPE